MRENDRKESVYITKFCAKQDLRTHMQHTCTHITYTTIRNKSHFTTAGMYKYMLHKGSASQQANAGLFFTENATHSANTTALHINKRELFSSSGL